MRFAVLALVAMVGSVGAASAPVPAEAVSPGVTTLDATLADGARWTARVPKHWNGTLLLFSHGYAFTLRAPVAAPEGVAPWLLQHGFALAASAYSKPGWALAEAVPDQLATVAAFSARFGKPKRTIAWGDSMGALVTVALAETYPERFAAALPACGSLAGSIGMMNEALDGAFTFKTLLAPASDIRLVDTGDDMANAGRVKRALDAAMQSPQGRARVALASALAQIPTWTIPKSPETAAGDRIGQLSQVAAAFVMGVFLPRADQESRAGGVFSWNEGVDYRRQLERSGRRAWVQQWYALAGLDLEADLARLNATARILAAPDAVAYMSAHYMPNGALRIPILTLDTVGDGATVPTQEEAYRRAVQAAGREAELAQSWVARAGHCQFSSAERIAALQTLLARLAHGRWDASPAALNARAAQLGLGESRFVRHVSAPFLRPCTPRQCDRSSSSQEH